MPLLRTALLQVSRNEKIKDLMLRVPITRDVVRRFVPGETMDQCLDAIRELTGKGLLVSVDCLGEDTTDPEMARHVVEQYTKLLRRLADEGLADRVEVSVKLSALGQFLGAEGEELAHDNALAIARAARDAGTTITLDMEDHTTVDSTLRMLDRLREEYPWVGCVLQAYLYRTEQDVRTHAVEGQRIRLCKGAYDEPETVAFRERAKVDASYVRCLRLLMESPAYPMIATHDPRMIEIAQDLAVRNGRDADSFEFQMLYGIRTQEQERLASLGHRVRVYLPYGTDWYGYFTRRLAERPANVVFFLRSFLGRR